MKLSDLPRINQSINEVKMSPQRLISKAKLNRYNIQVGFESEIVIPNGLSKWGNGNFLEDFKHRTVDTLDDVAELVDMLDSYSSLAQRVMAHAFRRLRDGYDDFVSDWQREQFNEVAEDKIYNLLINDVYDREEEIRKKLEERGLSEEEIEESIENEDRNYQLAESEVDDEILSDALHSFEVEDSYFQEAFNEFIDDLDELPSESEYLRDQGIASGEDVLSHFEIDLDESSENYDVSAVEHVANSYAMDMALPRNEINVLDSYHGESKDIDEWYFEPDSSIESKNGDDLHIEIVSPPMPISDALDAIEDHFKWMQTIGAETNESTGLHISVSIQDQTKNENIDNLKLALFAGDNKVLADFGRKANSYCQSYFEKIRKHKDVAEKDIPELLNKLKGDLSQLAERILSNAPKDKYQSINPKGEYVEFRSLGNKDYHKKLEEIQAAVGRFAYAYAVAADPNLHREEYLKKLYKLINPAKGTDLDIFTRYAAGDLTVAELKREWAAAILPKASDSVYTDYSIVDKQTNKIVGYVHAGSQDGAEWNAYEKLIPRNQRENTDLTKFLARHLVEPVDERRSLKSKLGGDPSEPADKGNMILWNVTYDFSGKTVYQLEAPSKEEAVREYARITGKPVSYVQANYKFDRAQGDMFSTRDLNKRQQLAKKVGQMKNIIWQVVKAPDVNTVVGEVEANRNSRTDAERAARDKLNISYDEWKSGHYLVLPKQN